MFEWSVWVSCGIHIRVLHISGNELALGSYDCEKDLPAGFGYSIYLDILYIHKSYVNKSLSTFAPYLCKKTGSGCVFRNNPLRATTITRLYEPGTDEELSVQHRPPCPTI